MSAAALVCRWTGTALAPASPYWAANAAGMLAHGERYVVTIEHERSAASHRHYHAQLHDIWLSLPDELVEQFPSVEHLRKRALIATGWREERRYVCGGREEARRLAAFVRPIDGFAAVSVHGNAVVVWTARSQSYRAMPREEFQRSKDAVLDFVAALLQEHSPAGAKQERRMRDSGGPAGELRATGGADGHA